MGDFLAFNDDGLVAAQLPSSHVQQAASTNHRALSHRGLGAGGNGGERQNGKK
jgi:hypothetical protein